MLAGTYRVLRGGGWLNLYHYLDYRRAAYRHSNYPYSASILYGFRIAR